MHHGGCSAEESTEEKDTKQAANEKNTKEREKKFNDKKDLEKAVEALEKLEAMAGGKGCDAYCHLEIQKGKTCDSCKNMDCMLDNDCLDAGQKKELAHSNVHSEKNEKIDLDRENRKEMGEKAREKALKDIEETRDRKLADIEKNYNSWEKKFVRSLLVISLLDTDVLCVLQKNENLQFWWKDERSNKAYRDGKKGRDDKTNQEECKRFKAGSRQHAACIGAAEKVNCKDYTPTIFKQSEKTGGAESHYTCSDYKTKLEGFSDYKPMCTLAQTLIPEAKNFTGVLPLAAIEDARKYCRKTCDLCPKNLLDYTHYTPNRRKKCTAAGQKLGSGLMGHKVFETNHETLEYAKGNCSASPLCDGVSIQLLMRTEL